MVTVGMNYEVVEGKNEPFERKFARVVEAMTAMSDHVSTRLYRGVPDAQSYLVVSEWTSREAFDAFVASDDFRSVTAWGTRGILRARPRHQVYEVGNSAAPVTGRCPVHADG